MAVTRPARQGPGRPEEGPWGRGSAWGPANTQLESGEVLRQEVASEPDKISVISS